MVEHKSPVEQKIDQSALWVPVFINISMQKHRCIVAKYINATNTLLFVVDDCWNTRAVLMQSRVEKVTSFISGICWNQEMPWMQISSVKTTHSQVCVWLILMTFCVMNVCRSSCSFAVPTRVLFFLITVFCVNSTLFTGFYIWKRNTAHLLMPRWRSWYILASTLCSFNLIGTAAITQIADYLCFVSLWAYYICDTSTIRVRFEYDSSTIRLQHATICVRFEYDSSAIQHPTRSYVLSSNNEHVNSFALL